MAQGVRWELAGQRFGRLSVLYRADHPRKWFCQCDCGRSKEVFTMSLVGGLTVSCGCYRDECTKRRSIRHGRTDTKEWRCWKNMLERCYHRSHKSFGSYGGRGVSVCERWRDRFENFLADMGEAPSPQHSLDRIDNDGDYAPGNCRWATPLQQTRNRSSGLRVTYHGVEQLLSEWCEQLGLDWARCRKRIFDMGWPPERAFEERPRRCRKPG